MALTVTNTNTLKLLNTLNRLEAEQTSTLTQLTTGKRINSGKDDPAGLIALSNLNAELTAVSTSLINNQRSNSVLMVADGAFAEIGSLLLEIEKLIVSSTSDATQSASERAANQSQIDNALDAIDRIVSTTNFNGKKLLDGSFSIASTGFSGNAELENLRIFSRSQSTADTTLNITRVASAQVASATFAFAGAGAATSGSTQVVLTGSLGTATITIASGTTQAGLVTAINATTAQTGVSAIQGSTNIELSSTSFGTDAFVSTEVLSGGIINVNYGTASSDGNTTNDIQNVSKQTGVDANITINGQNAGTDGLDVVYSANGLSVEFSLNSDFGSGNVQTSTTSFTVRATGGATFQLGTTASTRATIGIDSLATYKLGGGNGSNRISEIKSGGAVDLKTDSGAALTSIREAIEELSGVRGRIGGFQKFQIGSSIRALQAAQNGLTEAASAIGDTDFAVATADLNRQQILIEASIALLGIANQRGAQILSLL